MLATLSPAEILSIERSASRTKKSMPPAKAALVSAFDGGEDSYVALPIEDLFKVRRKSLDGDIFG
jgi:hypothetical protein